MNTTRELKIIYAFMYIVLQNHKGSECERGGNTLQIGVGVVRVNIPYCVFFSQVFIFVLSTKDSQKALFCIYEKKKKLIKHYEVPSANQHDLIII